MTRDNLKCPLIPSPNDSDDSGYGSVYSVEALQSSIDRKTWSSREPKAGSTSFPISPYTSRDLGPVSACGHGSHDDLDRSPASSHYQPQHGDASRLSSNTLDHQYHRSPNGEGQIADSHSLSYERNGSLEYCHPQYQESYYRYRNPALSSLQSPALSTPYSHEFFTPTHDYPSNDSGYSSVNPSRQVSDVGERPYLDYQATHSNPSIDSGYGSWNPSANRYHILPSISGTRIESEPALNPWQPGPDYSLTSLDRGAQKEQGSDRAGAHREADQEEESNSQATAIGVNGTHALQDYQWQLMLLEQQNQKRILYARQLQQAAADSDAPPIGSNIHISSANSPRDSGYGSSNTSPCNIVQDIRFVNPNHEGQPCAPPKSVSDRIVAWSRNPQQDLSFNYIDALPSSSPATFIDLTNNSEKKLHTGGHDSRKQSPQLLRTRLAIELPDESTEHKPLDTACSKDFSEDTSSQSDDNGDSQPASPESCKNVLLARAKHKMIACIMKDVYALLDPNGDVAVRQHIVFEGRGSVAAQNSMWTQHDGDRQPGRRRKRDDDTSPPGDGNNDDDRKRSKRSPSKVKQNDSQLTYACPFHKYDPQKYRPTADSGSLYRTCVGPGFKSISRVK